MAGHAVAERLVPPQEVEILLALERDLHEVVGAGDGRAKHQQQDLRE